MRLLINILYLLAKKNKKNYNYAHKMVEKFGKSWVLLIIHVWFCVFQIHLNETVNFFCTLPALIKNIQMIQCVSTIKA